MPDYGLFGAEHVRQYEATGGKVGHDWNGAPVLVLQTTGRRSGEIRKFPLIYGRDGNDYVIVASKGGAAEHPGWYRNLVAHPDVKIQVRDKVLPARARTGTAEDKKRVWPTMTGAMARVRQVPGRDQARHSDRAAQPPLKPDERQLEDSVGSILASYARQGELAHLEGGSLPSRDAIWEVVASKGRRVILNSPSASLTVSGASVVTIARSARGVSAGSLRREGLTTGAGLGASAPPRPRSVQWRRGGSRRANDAR